MKIKLKQRALVLIPFQKFNNEIEFEGTEEEWKKVKDSLPKLTVNE